MNIPFPQNDPIAWDYVIVAGRLLPCLREYPKAKPGRKLDAKSAPGSSGGRIVDKGYDLAKVTVTVSLWTEEHFRTWGQLLDVIKPRAGRARDAVSIYHPALESVGISAVVVESISSIEHSGTAGIYRASFEAVQYQPPARGANARASGRGDTQTPAAPEVAAVVDTQANGSLGPGAAIPATPPSPRARRSGT